MSDEDEFETDQKEELEVLHYMYLTEFSLLEDEEQDGEKKFEIRILPFEDQECFSELTMRVQFPKNIQKKYQILNLKNQLVCLMII